MNFFYKFKIILLVLFFIISSFIEISCEKWVGQAATYQLIEGTKIANGDFFDKDSLSAACNGFKLGAEVTIINPKNGKKSTVIINDRINSNSTYFILITPKVAKDLEFEWETGLVVIEANFSDVNSTERLAINGLVREGEIDLETLKKFPEIIWPKDDKMITDKLPTEYEDKGYPSKEEKEMPEKEIKIAKLDTDEKNGYIEKGKDQYEATPKKEEKITPEEKMKIYAMSKDEEDKKSEKEEIIPKKEEKIALAPEEKKQEDKIDVDTKEKEEKIIEKTEEPVVWEKNLLKDKIYIRFSTTFDKAEGERRYKLFKKIFIYIVGIEKEGKYVLYIGPINEDKIDYILKKIRNYGYKDAYIVKG